MKTFLTLLLLNFAVLTSGCATDSSTGSGAESQDKNEPAPRSRSRAY